MRSSRRRASRLAAFRSVLPVFDDLQLAVKNVPENAHEFNWMEGVLLIERKFLEILGGCQYQAHRGGGAAL